MTGSRKGLVGALICVILWVIFCYIPTVKKGDYFRKLCRFLLVLAALVAVVVMLLPHYQGSKLQFRMQNLFHEVTEGTRANMYRNGIELFMSSLLFGYGFTGFEYFFNSYSHATLVEVPVSGGIFGSIMYISAFVMIALKLLSLRKKYKGALIDNKNSIRVRMSIVMFGLMLFYATCIIHPYQMSSNVSIGIISALCLITNKDAVEANTVC